MQARHRLMLVAAEQLRAHLEDDMAATTAYTIHLTEAHLRCDSFQIDIEGTEGRQSTKFIFLGMETEGQFEWSAVAGYLHAKIRAEFNRYGVECTDLDLSPLFDSIVPSKSVPLFVAAFMPAFHLVQFVQDETRVYGLLLLPTQSSVTDEKWQDMMRLIQSVLKYT
jgi:hypothetical protein